MSVIRTPLFDGDTLRIGLFEAHPVSDACGDLERQTLNAVVLPLSGVFSKHDTPGRHVIGTPSHAVFFAADTPYRIGFPGAIGDRALTLLFGDDVASEHLAGRGQELLPSHALLPAGAIMLRGALLARLKRAETDEFEIGTLGFELLALSLDALRQEDDRHPGSARRQQAVERVKEAIACAPSDRWSLAELADIACLSPFHLCRVFRQMVGTSIYDYLLRERLTQSLDAVLDGGDLTMIALDAGFASHSHFTDRFRRLFGWTPTAMRKAARAASIDELRTILTARRDRPLVN